MMDCKAFALLLDTPWEKLTQAQRDEMEQHAAQCPDCAMALQIQRDMQGWTRMKPCQRHSRRDGEP